MKFYLIGSDFMYCIALLQSGNFAFNLCRILEEKRIPVEVISTPCNIAKNGCSYCIKVPCERVNDVIQVSREHNILIEEVYGVIPAMSKNKYQKMF